MNPTPAGYFIFLNIDQKAYAAYLIDSVTKRRCFNDTVSVLLEIICISDVLYVIDICKWYLYVEIIFVDIIDLYSHRSQIRF